MACCSCGRPRLKKKWPKLAGAAVRKMNKNNNKKLNQDSARADESTPKLRVENINWEHHEFLYILGKLLDVVSTT